jgi:hypothetical protein
MKEDHIMQIRHMDPAAALWSARGAAELMSVLRGRNEEVSIDILVNPVASPIGQGKFRIDQQQSGRYRLRIGNGGDVDLTGEPWEIYVRLLQAAEG